MRADVRGCQIHFDAFPAALPIWIGEEAPQYLRVQLALALEIAVEASVCEARPGHDLSDGDIIKAVAIEEPARALNDFPFYLGTVASGVGHKSSGFRRSMARRAVYFP